MRVKLLVLFLLGVTPFFLFTLSAESEPELSVSPVDTTVTLGTSFELQVVVNADVTDLMGYNITVKFEQPVLGIESVDEGSLLLNCGHPSFFCWLNRGSGNDSVLVNGAVLGAGVDGPGRLFTMNFVASGCGPCDVCILASELRNSLNQSIVHIVQHGVVDVPGPTNVECTTWGAVKKKF